MLLEKKENMLKRERKRHKEKNKDQKYIFKR